MRRSVALATLVLGGLLAASAASAQVVQITSNVSANSSWGPTGSVVGTIFWVKNSISIDAAATLNIQPGVIVKFNPGCQLTVNGRLKSIGTGASNIYFTSYRDDGLGGDTNGDGASTPAASDWAGIVFPDGSTDFGSRFDYSDIRFAGYSSTGGLTFASSSDSVTNSYVRRSYYGVDCAGTAAPVLVNTSIEASTQTPIVLDFTAAPVFSSLVFSTANNGYDAFGLRGATLSSGQNVTLPRRGATVGVNPVPNVTYVLLAGLTINPGASLTINPGVVIKPVSNYGIQVDGNLTMNGTGAAGDTITITSIHDDTFGSPGDTDHNGSSLAPGRGDWNRIVFDPGSTGSLSRCRLKFGSNASTQGMVEMSGVSIPVSNSLLTDASHGVTAYGTASPALTNLDIQNCSSSPVLLSLTANPTFTNVNFLANAITAIGLQGEAVGVDCRIPVRTVGGYSNITYYLMNNTLQILSPAVLRIDPGVVIKNQISTGQIQIDGSLVADGKVDSLIVFTSERDDAYGNPADTNGDGGGSSPAQGNWYFLRFTAGSNDAVSKLDYCRIAYGSLGPFDGVPTSLWLQSASPPITNCTIARGSYGIRMDGDSAPLIDGCAFTNLGAAPYAVTVRANPNITANNSYASNVYNAIALTSEDPVGSCRIRYRPGVGSPTFAYMPTGTINIPAGTTVSIDPQVVIKPIGTSTIFTVSGTLNVVGSNNTTGRVVFTSRRDDTPAYGGDSTPNDAAAPQAGDWSNIIFNDTSVDAACVMRNVLFAFGASGGDDNGVIATVNASPRLVNLEFFQNETAFTFSSISQPVVDSTAILNCTQLPLVASLLSNPQFPHPNLITLANNVFTCFGIQGETVSQDVRTRVRALGSFPNISYCPSGTITIAFGSKWTIDPGVVIKMGRIFTDPIGYNIVIDGALVADGKPDSLIVFTSSADDAFGNDIRSDGALTSPAASQWDRIQFDAISNDAVSVLDNVRIRYGGFSSIGALRIVSAGPPITNSYVTSTAGPGIYIEGDSSPSFSNVNVDSSTNVPVLMSLVSKPTFSNVQFLANTYNALGVINETLAQDVRWPIRAVGGRNNIPYLLQGTLTVGLNAVLTMQPGVVVKFTNGALIDVQRGMIAQGRTVEPESLIVFTSYRDDFYGGDISPNDATAPLPSDWNYITIENTAIDAQCQFRNCVFRYGGSGSTFGALRCVSASPGVDSTMFVNNTVGISVEGASNPIVHGSTFLGNTQFAINNTGNSFCVNAEGNYWGAANGPNDNSATTDLCGITTNAGGGDKVSNNVDYAPFATSGILNPLLGDVSLNGQVLAYDASLVLQYAVAAISLNPLQLSVADVSGTAGVTAGDASLILQYVAGVIPAFPAISNLTQGPPTTIAAARQVLAQMKCCATVTLGAPYRDGADWIVPVRATADQPIYGFELRIAGAAAGRLADVETPNGGALTAHAESDGEARVAVASAASLANGEVARLRFHGADAFEAPLLAWARVNESEAAGSVATGPAISFLAPPAPNPARGVARLRFSIAARDAGTTASVKVVDVTGRSVRTLVSGPLAVGPHDMAWDLADEAGRPVAAGLYFIRADAGPIHATQRLIVVR